MNDVLDQAIGLAVQTYATERALERSAIPCSEFIKLASPASLVASPNKQSVQRVRAITRTI
jgi:hypothetical protein